MHFLEKRGKFFSKHPKLNSSKALLRIVNSYFWKSISGPFLTFIFPIILVCVLGFSLGYSIAFPGAFFMGIIAVGLNVMPGTICEFRKSSLLKRISITPIKPIRILITICLYYLLVMIASIIITIFLTLLIFIKYFKNGQTIEISNECISVPSLSQVLSHVDYPSFIYVTILIFIISLLTGLMFCSFFTSTSTINSVSIMVMILTILLSGLAVPNSIMKSNIPLWYTGYALTPFKSVICSAFESWNGSFKDNFGLISGYNYQMNNCNGSHVFDMSSSYVVYSTVILPGITSGKITILSISEK